MNRFLKNRSFQVKLLNDAPSSGQVAVQPKPVDVAEVVTLVAAGTMAVIATYMVADTIRQSVIFTVCQKVK